MFSGLQPSQASNLWQERDIRRDIENSVPARHIVDLDIGKRNPVLALYTASQQVKSEGGAIILHDFGHHPNWPGVAAPLRENLPKSGWHTLTIQMPIPDAMWRFDRPEDILEASIKRIQAGIEYLKQRNVDYLVLIAHGESAALSSYYLSNENTPFKAFVAISITHNDAVDDWRNIRNSLKNMPLPLLDIFAQNDLEAVRDFSEMRLIAARVAGNNLRRGQPPIPHSDKVRQLAKKQSNNLWYRQIIVPGAHPGFVVEDEDLLKNIRGWLSHYARKKP